jgi:ankyrin repeat protein
MHAVMKLEDVHMVNYFFNKGVAVNLADDQGLKALYDASQNGHSVVVEALIKAGAESYRLD